jgi:hypothetical protein
LALHSCLAVDEDGFGDMSLTMKTIPLMKSIEVSKIHIALVDDYDYEYLSRFVWYYTKGYAIRKGTFGETISMHREIVNVPKGMDVDHKNGDRMDNQKSNLRIVTRQQNNWNSANKRNSSSEFKGVSWHSTTKQWRAAIRIDGVKTLIGTFKDERHAAMAYDIAAKDIQGEYARLNFLPL